VANEQSSVDGLSIAPAECCDRASFVANNGRGLVMKVLRRHSQMQYAKWTKSLDHRLCSVEVDVRRREEGDGVS